MIRKLFVILLSVAGLFACLATHRNAADGAPPLATRLEIVLLSAAALVAAIPATARALSRFFDRVRSPNPRQRALFSCALGTASIAYLIFTAFHQHRPLYPRFHDENMYLLQMRLMSGFRLWAASPHNPDFFDSFHMLVRPVYAAIYFPGTALLYTWELWLHAPAWVGPVLVAGAIIALTFRISAELLDDAVLGAVTALMVLGVINFRYLSMVVMSHSVVMVLGLAMMWAYLRWRKNPSIPWTILIGALAGWCGITRPIDGICYAAPVGIAMLMHLFKTDRRLIARTIVIGSLSAVPLLSLQLILDKGVTGHWLKTPYQLYTELSSPNLAYGARQFDPTAIPHTVILQKKFYDEYFNKPSMAVAAANSPIDSWLEWKFYRLMNCGLAANLMVILLPIGLLDLDRRRVWLLWSVVPIYIIGYAFFAFLMPYYCVVPSPAIALAVVMGARAAIRAFPSAASQLYVFFTLSLSILSITSFNEFSKIPDDNLKTTTMKIVAVDLPRLIHKPAIVLFHFAEGDDFNQEPVYNLTTINIDDAFIIRAHDLGPERNRELMDYYAKHQPDREVYVFDRATSVLRPMGTARDLARQFPLGGEP